MTERQQRFCPVCDRGFEPGEALLRCTGCNVLHHPGCWVRNGGCATDEIHESQSEPMPYPGAPRGRRREQPEPRRRDTSPYGPDVKTVPGPAPPKPGRAPRGSLPPMPVSQPAPQPQMPPPAAAPPPPAYAYDDEPVIGGAPPPAAYPPPYTTAPPPAALPYPPTGPPMSQSMPRVYREPGGILRFWYVPVALLLVAVVAAGVIFIGERYLVGDDDDGVAADPEGTETPAGEPTEATTATGSPGPTSDGEDGTPAAEGTATPGEGEPTAPAADGEGPQVGSTVLVSGTGDCLNLRSDAGLDAAIIICLIDGSQLEVIGGPVMADGLRWLRVSGDLGEGWAADQFLTEQ